MVENKFDKIFADRPGAAPAPAPVPTAEPVPPSPPTDAAPAHKAAARSEPRRRAEPPPTVRPIGRPPGKRSDPAWKQYSVLLKIETQREAANILRAKNEGQDFSGLVQGLVENWVKRHRS